jgi:hypothetical protein
MSAFVWLDYSERERRKMLDVVDLFGEHDTRDELGIGSVRDAFADESVQSCGVFMQREPVGFGSRRAESLCANDGMRLPKCH